MDKQVIALKNELKRRGIKGIALDIDETLSWTAGRWTEEMTKRFGNPENLTTEEILLKYRLVQNYWNNKEAVEWLKKARGNNKLQETLPLIENSNHFVNKINQIVPVACYLTIRPESVMEGTSVWLEKYNFPKAKIIAKPKKIDYSEGSKWKAKALELLYPEVQGIVDDNWDVIDYLPSTYKGFIFLYRNFYLYTGKLNLILCPTWEDVLSEVKEKFTKD